MALYNFINTRVISKNTFADLWKPIHIMILPISSDRLNGKLWKEKKITQNWISRERKNLFR